MSQVNEENFDDDLHLEHQGQEGFNDDVDVNLVADDDQDDDGAAERKARAERMGWSDKDKFRGDPDRWVDFDEFLQRGEERLPILQERLRKQDGEIAGMRRELSQVIENQGKFERETREQVRQEFEERKAAAVDEADRETYDQVTKEQREWEEKQSTDAPAASSNEAVDPSFAPWREKNNWYGTNENMTRFANSQGPLVLDEFPEVKGTAAFYEKVEERVRRMYPEHFTNPRRNEPGRVEGARASTGGAGRKKTYADLPPAAKAKCDQYVEKGWVTDQAEYVKTYFGEGE